MATVGIVGGLGPESTIDYYRRITEAWERDGASAAPSIVIDSLDVRRALALVERDVPALTEYLLASLCRLARAGVDFAAMTANTPHIVFDDLAEQSPVPLVSIVEVCAEEARRRGLRRLALLGTRFTMEAAFYPTVCARLGVAVVTPDAAERAWVHERYVGELLKGEFRDDTRRRLVALVRRLRDEEHVEGVILGGTELPLLLPEPTIADLPALDTTALHVTAIVERLRRPAPEPSAAGAPLGDAAVQRFLDGKQVAILATARADGAPLATPMWFLHDPAVLTMISVAATQKVRNLRRDPRVCVVAESAEGGVIRGVTVLGRAELLADGPERRALAERFHAKYPGLARLWNGRAMPADRVMFRIVPRRVRAWGLG